MLGFPRWLGAWLLTPGSANYLRGRRGGGGGGGVWLSRSVSFRDIKDPLVGGGGKKQPPNEKTPDQVPLRT